MREFRRAAKAAGPKVKDAARAAVLAWTSETTPVDVNDTFFKSQAVDMGDNRVSSSTKVR